MKVLAGSIVAMGVLVYLASAAAQDQSGQGENGPPATQYQANPQNPQANGPVGQPDPSVVPQDPRLQARPPSYSEAQNAPGQDPRRSAGGQGAPAAPRLRVPPFTLSAHEEVQLARMLAAWEQRSSRVDRFHCTFFKFQYDRFFNQSTPGTAEAPITDKGEIYYAAPDKGVFKVEPPQEKKEKSAPSREQKWICDGKAVYEYDFDNHEIRKYVIPPEQQGEGIREGPLPFIFGAKAARLSCALLDPDQYAGRRQGPDMAGGLPQVPAGRGQFLPHRPDPQCRKPATVCTTDSRLDAPEQNGLSVPADYRQRQPAG